MTRLVENDIKHIKGSMKNYDGLFRRQTGYSLDAIARRTAGIGIEALGYRAAVIPFTSGGGIISGFSDSVCEILRCCSVDAFVTKHCDVDGIYEAVSNRADIIFMADDERFIAFGTGSKAVADNGICTGEGFGEALICAMKMRNERVLVLGASVVGRAAAQYLKKNHIAVDIYDINKTVLGAADLGGSGIRKLSEPPVMGQYKYLYDATTSGDFITVNDVSSETVIAAPGMPRGVTEEACRVATVIHNPLELGVATMYYECAKQIYLKESESD